MRGRRENGSVVIEVADTGSGIPAPDRARIFDRFYRARRPTDGGFGLGLSIAREAVRTLGGEIELESEQSVGTTVRITLATASEGAPLRSATLSPRILVVDDEPSLVRGLTYALERDKFEVEVATDGEAAVEAALTQAVDLVILDLMLPRLSGEEACRQIRAQSDVPIIMLTAKDSERDLLDGPRDRRRRLRDEAVLRRRADRPGRARCCAGASSTRPRTSSSCARSARSRSTSSATRCRSRASRSR